MLDNIKLHNILFLDVETVPFSNSFSELPNVFQELWAEKLSGNEKRTTRQRSTTG